METLAESLRLLLNAVISNITGEEQGEATTNDLFAARLTSLENLADGIRLLTDGVITNIQRGMLNGEPMQDEEQ